LRWQGGEEDSLRAFEFFLIVDRGWVGSPTGDAEVSLSLQNGPDAIRLLFPSGATDILGYGDLSHPALFETTPHPDADTGHSLGRRPDGNDSDNNEKDWQQLNWPTPAEPNFRAFAAEVEFLRYEPPSISITHQSVHVSLRLKNSGLADLPAGPVILSAGGAEISGWSDMLAPGQSRLVQFFWQPATRGRQLMQIVISVGGSREDLVVNLPSYQVGQSELYLSEVMAAPSQGGCEWVEIGNASSAPIEVSTVTLRDEDGDWHALPPALLSPGELLVLVQNRQTFLRWWGSLQMAGSVSVCSRESVSAAAHELPGSWPSLNNTAPDDRTFADRLYLGDGQGCVLDHVTWGDRGMSVASGRSLERIALEPKGDPHRNWAVATSRIGSTPACRNSLAGRDSQTGEFSLAPNPFYPEQGEQDTVLHLMFTLEESEQAWEVRIFDLWGRGVRDLGGDELGPGPRDVFWDGRSDEDQLVPPGAYVVLLRITNAGGSVTRGRKRLAIVGNESSP
jgi:hypothetical protein